MNKRSRKNIAAWQIRKYCRRCGRYLRRVRMIEREIGGCIEAC